MRARHRLSKLLLRQGIVYSGGHAWTAKHDAWLRRQHFVPAATRLTYESDYDAVLSVAARRNRLDAAITAMAADSEFTPDDPPADPDLIVAFGRLPFEPNALCSYFATRTA